MSIKLPTALHLLIAFMLMVTSAHSADIPSLCSQTIATLTPYVGDPKQTTSGQRVEVRQCPINLSIGTMQIVAWNANATVPSIVIDTELRGLKQLVMIPGAYAFEAVSASASAIFGIVFENGQAREAVRDSTKGTTVITSDRNSIRIDLYDGSARKRSHILRGELSSR